MSAKQQLKKEIREAYLFLREKNQSIPSETLEFMLNASLEKVDSFPDVNNNPFNFVDDRLEKVETLHHLNLNDDEKEFAANVINLYGNGQHPWADDRTIDGFAINYLKELFNKLIQNKWLNPKANSLVQSITEKIETYVTNQ